MVPLSMPDSPSDNFSDTEENLPIYSNLYKNNSKPTFIQNSLN